MKLASFFCLHPYARGGSQSGHNGRKHGDDDVEYFTPKIFIHGFMYYVLCIMYDVLCMMYYVGTWRATLIDV